MKKNRMMRIASVLLVAVLLSTCAISGTFAKYVTTGSGQDTARVAKWGVDVAIVSGESFKNEYAKHDDTYTGSLSVKSSDDEKVVAPGTSSADVAGDVTFKITGTPEVAVEVAIDFNATKEIKLAAGDYNNYKTGGDLTDTFNLGSDYYPVKFTLTMAANGTTETLVEDGTLKAVENALTSTKKYDPKTTLDVTYTLTWEWAFDDSTSNDEADTYLASHNHDMTIAYDLTITVTQVD